jgi:hypothetical protein
VKPGIYYVTFSASASNRVGEGLAVFKDNKVNGGDIGYLYRGSYSTEGLNVTAKLNIKRWNSAMTSVFGTFPDYDLDLTGTASPDWSYFSVEGAMVQPPNLKITIKGRRLDDAV